MSTEVGLRAAIRAWRGLEQRFNPKKCCVCAVQRDPEASEAL
jgi:hypothetical protein